MRKTNLFPMEAIFIMTLAHSENISTSLGNKLEYNGKRT